MPAATARRGRPPGKQGVELLAVARETFLELGFDRTTMQDIARRAGVSKSSLYREHASKDELFTAVVSNWTEQGHDAMRPHLEALLGSDDLEGGLRSFTAVLARAVLAQPVVGMRRLVAAEADRFPEVAELYLRTSWQANIEALAAALSDLAGKGRLRMSEPLVAAEQLVWMGVGAALNARSLGVATAEVDDEGITQTVATFLARYGSTSPAGVEG